jgi:hypothetical protein
MSGLAVKLGILIKFRDAAQRDPPAVPNKTRQVAADLLRLGPARRWRAMLS